MWLDSTSFGSIVEVAVNLQLRALHFFVCPFVGGRCIRPLVQLLVQDAELRELSFYNEGNSILESDELDGDVERAVHDALLDALASSSLRVVSLKQCGIEYFGANIIQIFVGHPFLEELSLMSDFRDDNGGPNAEGEEFSFATALGELVAFDSPALRSLRLAGQLRERALPLFDALPHNTHLQHLELNGSCMNAEFLREVVFPRVRENTSLLVLNIHFDGPDFDNDADDADYQLAWPIMDELRDFVRDRAAAAAAVGRAPGEAE